MKKQLNDDTIREFLKNQIDTDITDFGYLLIPKDSRLNDEALMHIKDKFYTYCQENGYE
jgi:hypothetical protein|tara:strand:- start:222 stop:398 length:177 start_codon:yes stop_codon:yes gene_type:complete